MHPNEMRGRPSEENSNVLIQQFSSFFPILSIAILNSACKYFVALILLRLIVVTDKKVFHVGISWWP